MKYTLILEKIWSNKWYLPRATSFLYTKLGSKYYPVVSTNFLNNYCYRVKLSIVKIKHLEKRIKNDKN